MCDRNNSGEHPSCISALLDGPGAEDHGFCEPCSIEIRRQWKEKELQIGELQALIDEKPNCDTLVPPEFQRFWEACVRNVEKADFKLMLKYVGKLEDKVKEKDRLKDEQAQLLSKCLDVFARFAGGPIIAHPPKCRFYIEMREKDCTCKAKDLMSDVLLTLKDLRAALEKQEPLKRKCDECGEVCNCVERPAKHKNHLCRSTHHNPGWYE